MDRRRIEQITASIAVSMLFFMTSFLILFIADQMFEWDIFPPSIEKVIAFLMIAGLGIILSSVVVNIMINFSVLAISSSQIAEKLTGESHESRKKT